MQTAAWLGATEAIAARPEMRDELFARARTQRPPTDGAGIERPRRSVPEEAPLAAPTSGDGARADLPRVDRASGRDAGAPSTRPRPTCRRRTVSPHATSSCISPRRRACSPRLVDRTVVPEITDDDIDARTAVVRGPIPRGIRSTTSPSVWRQSVDEVAAWADDPDDASNDRPVDRARDAARQLPGRAGVRELDPPRRPPRRQGEAPEAPPAAELHEMANLSMRTLPFALLVSDRAHPGKVARVVLTGPGGGEWQLSMGGQTRPRRCTTRRHVDHGHRRLVPRRG